MRGRNSLLVVLALVAIVVTGCSSVPSPPQVQQDLLKTLDGRDIKIPVNQVELNNYNKRQELSDQPTTIIWCTSAFDNPSSPMFTVAIIGKLTSGNKRPFPASQHTEYEGRTTELPGPDGMYGSSGEYRFGFGPADQYYDMYNLDTFCTTEPTVWQRESTTLVLDTDPVLSEAQRLARVELDMAYAEDLAAEEAQKAGDTGVQAQHEAAAAEYRSKAQAILEQAITAATGGN